MQLVNPDGSTINSAYGHLIWHKKSHGNPSFEFAKEFDALDEELRTNGASFYSHEGKVMHLIDKAKRTPWEWAKQSLIQDKDTRQAILRFSLPEHQWMGNKDQVCTLHGNFQIRDDKLHLSITMRSNDLMKGLVYDLPWFVSLMYKMQNELRGVYPDLQIGTYTHLSHSMHIYKRDIPAINKMLGRVEIIAKEA
jgi:thymidylate synthase